MYHIKKDRRSIQSGKWIYEALCGLVQKKDYDRITVTELVEKAGVGRATFYRNFDSIDDVLQMKCDECTWSLTELFSDNRKAEQSIAPHRLFLRFWYDHSDIIELLQSAKRSELLLQAFEKMFLELARRNEKVEHIPEKMLEYILSFHVGASAAVLMKWVTNGKNIPPDEMADFMDEMVRRVRRSSDQKS